MRPVNYKTTVLNPVFKGFRQLSIPPLISIFYAKEGYHDFSFEIFCLTVPKKFVGEPFCASKIFYYRKNSRIGKEGVPITTFRRHFLSHRTETFRRGTLLCFRKCLVSKNVSDQRGAGYHNFPSKLFCLTVPVHFVEESFCASESCRYRKNLPIRQGSSTIFFDSFFSQCRNFSSRNLLVFH